MIEQLEIRRGCAGREAISFGFDGSVAPSGEPFGFGGGDEERSSVMSIVFLAWSWW